MIELPSNLPADLAPLAWLVGAWEGSGVIEVSLAHSDGVSELYLGEAHGPRITMATDAVIRSASAHVYTAATRMYGLVDSHLLWAWDIAALGAPLASHASARLAKVQ